VRLQILASIEFRLISENVVRQFSFHVILSDLILGLPDDKLSRAEQPEGNGDTGHDARGVGGVNLLPDTFQHLVRRELK
jgi:hypothetical protein